MASELAIYYTPMHFMWGVKSGTTPVRVYIRQVSPRAYFLSSQNDVIASFFSV